MTDHVLFSVEGRVGRVRLNRPKAIHALDLAMCQAMGRQLLAWIDEPTVEAVLIDHAPAPDGPPTHPGGFCAGGDVRGIANAADGTAARAFFHEEYRLNHLLFTYPKPIVAFMDGITMGGGVGISQPARYRIATERTVFAMPETTIGLFPDVGGGRYLSRLPGRMGQYLALTGARLDGAACHALGLATHVIAADRLDGVKRAIADDPQAIAATLDAAHAAPPAPAIFARRTEIDRLFAGETLEQVLADLAADPSDFAAQELAGLRTKSPQSCKVSLRLLREGAHLTDFADEMRMEYAVAAHVCQRPDFAEGVRALLIDKDNAPRWDPPTPEQVTDHMIDTIFSPLPEGEAWTPYRR